MNPNQDMTHAKREFKPGDKVGLRVPHYFDKNKPQPGDMLMVLKCSQFDCVVEELRTNHRYTIPALDLDSWEIVPTKADS